MHKSQGKLQQQAFRGVGGSHAITSRTGHQRCNTAVCRVPCRASSYRCEGGRGGKGGGSDGLALCQQDMGIRKRERERERASVETCLSLCVKMNIEYCTAWTVVCLYLQYIPLCRVWWQGTCIESEVCWT